MKKKHKGTVLMRNIQIAAPGYILMDLMKQDMPGTLRALAQIGFDGMEFLGFFSHSAKEIKAWCRDVGIAPFSSFIKLSDLTGETSAMTVEDFSPFEASTVMPGKTPESKLEYLCELGCEYAGMLIPFERITPALCEEINKVNELCRSFGLKLQYHNHDNEYLSRTESGYQMDQLLSLMDKSVLFEPDLGWMEIGGCRCEEQIRKYADRIEVVHIKDYERESFDTSKPYVNRPTGYGVMDWKTILPLCETLIAPKWYTTDHDHATSGDVLGELKLSYDFARQALNQLI